MKSIFLLTCKDKIESKSISRVLIEKKLAVCCRAVDASSTFFWNNNVDNASEILLFIDSKEELFDEVEAEIAKIHSYDTFVLFSIPISQVSQKANKWWDENLK